MTARIPDHFWHGATLGCERHFIPWLHDYGSLTLRIQQRCNEFSVRPVQRGLARIARDESVLLGIPSRQLAYSREVFLYANNQPVVFAHSTCAAEHLRGTWGAVKGLGNRPLGAMLFSHPLVVRQPLHFRRLHPPHPLYRKAVVVLDKRPSQLWARRSLFYLQGAPLLVTEVFLPEILRLSDSA